MDSMTLKNMAKDLYEFIYKVDRPWHSSFYREWNFDKGKNCIRITRRKKGVRIEYYDINNCKLFFRTEKGGYKFEKEGNLKDLLDEGKKYNPPIMERETPEPMEFPKNDIRYTTVERPVTLNSGNGVKQWAQVDMLSRSTVIGKAAVIGICKIGKDNSVTFHTSVPDDEDVWFFCCCESPNNATFDIITDGEKYFYPVDRSSGKVSKNMKPKKSVDLNDLCDDDIKLLSAAIEMFMRKLNGEQK